MLPTTGRSTCPRSRLTQRWQVAAPVHRCEYRVLVQRLGCPHPRCRGKTGRKRHRRLPLSLVIVGSGTGPAGGRLHATRERLPALLSPKLLVAAANNANLAGQPATCALAKRVAVAALFPRIRDVGLRVVHKLLLVGQEVIGAIALRPWALARLVPATQLVAELVVPGCTNDRAPLLGGISQAVPPGESFATIGISCPAVWRPSDRVGGGPFRAQAAKVAPRTGQSRDP
eukprot:scaffold1124_cov131-Isochrysis_galbana.AAC.3